MNCRYMYILEFGFVKIVITIAIYFPAVSWNSCDSGFDKGAEKLSDSILIAPLMITLSKIVKWIRNCTYFISIRYDVVFTELLPLFSFNELLANYNKMSTMIKLSKYT